MPNSDLKVLGEKVRKERKLAGLTQEQLAERCHVSTKHIANIEKGSMNSLTSFGQSIVPILDAMCQWGNSYLGGLDVQPPCCQSRK